MSTAAFYGYAEVDNSNVSFSVERKLVRGQEVAVKVYASKYKPSQHKQVAETYRGGSNISWDYWEAPKSEAGYAAEKQQRYRQRRLANKRAIKVLITQLYDKQHTLGEIVEATGKSEEYIKTVLFGYKPAYNKS